MFVLSAISFHSESKEALPFRLLSGNKAFLETFPFCWSSSIVFVSDLTSNYVIFHLRTQNIFGGKKKTKNKAFQIKNWKQDILTFSKSWILFISKLKLSHVNLINSDFFLITSCSVRHHLSSCSNKMNNQAWREETGMKCWRAVMTETLHEHKDRTEGEPDGLPNCCACPQIFCFSV